MKDHILVARKPFRSNGVFYCIGSVIEDPMQVRFLKTKLKDGKIIRVNEENLTKYVEYLEIRAGKELQETFEIALGLCEVETEILLEKQPEDVVVVKL